MSNDEEKNEANILRQRADDALTNSIISFETPQKLRELCIQEQEPKSKKHTTDEIQFKIRIASTDQRRSQVNSLGS
ncbi:hypothetical protein [Sulfurirhabdus autotrophica]|uniref:Uncharacterized protein n=1 Tax=Sulfurirhabdus autotrophica TaxID=1706046 RepID=A0A4R3Y4G8_9PROT|nr:hypothetical protein [Sulfurirhabdus autotrophica]TCV86640.1 hypothetical protein EDC63_1061 [Sulfurirhabdus autotrophica]